MRYVLSIEPTSTAFGKAWRWSLTRVRDEFRFQREHASYSGLSRSSGTAATKWGARRAARQAIWREVLHRSVTEVERRDGWHGRVLLVLDAPVLR